MRLVRSERERRDRGVDVNVANDQGATALSYALRSGAHTMEDGVYVSTAWAALAVRDFAPAGYEREAAVSQARSAAWLSQRATSARATDTSPV